LNPLFPLKTAPGTDFFQGAPAPKAYIIVIQATIPNAGIINRVGCKWPPFE